MRTRMYGGVTGKAGDRLPISIWPCVSPNVICAGGTTTARNPQTGNFLYELTWGEAGGGLSAYEPRPAYQNTLSTKVGPYRGVPDLSFDSNPDTGAWVWDGNDFEGGAGGWFIVGGTSLASPALAGIVNSAATLHKSFAVSSSAENTTLCESCRCG
jgi:kumamolisin